MLNERKGGTQKKECAYCGTPVLKEDTVLFEGKHYHRKCGDSIRTRKTHPHIFRRLDKVRSSVESLYDDSKLVVASCGELRAIESILSDIQRKQIPKTTTLNEG